MSNKSVKDQNESVILTEINAGKIFREGTDQIYRFSGDVTDACIDSSRYAAPQSLRLSISEEIIDLIDGKESIQERFKIAELDKENLIAAYLTISQHYSIEDISTLLTSKDAYLESIGVGLSVIYENPQLIPPSNIEGLYKYFRSCEIKAKELKYFTSEKFIKYSFGKMLKEERVIFTWMINNLTSLVDIDAVSIDENFEFFSSLLINNDYPNETHNFLFLSALRKNPILIEKILKIKLNIDPFTKQYNYSKWLTEVRRFKFISNLRDSLPEEYSSDETLLFDQIKFDLYRINRNDRSLAV